ncbi:MAG: 23S rRNA (adenine(2030)-N(6))-methyltransferase RlmJ [Pseudomonadales bacterium]
MSATRDGATTGDDTEHGVRRRTASADMLSYLHEYHAGNFADVLKHLVLVRVLEYLTRKPAPLRYVDTHAGAGLYRLDGTEALQTREFHDGIARLWVRDDVPEVIVPYLDLVRRCNGDGPLRTYPGSPWLARAMLRQQDRLDLCELHPREFSLLQAQFAGARRSRCHQQDGFAVSLALMPPVERRGLVLIDPSYEIKTDYPGVVRHVAALHRRFATGTYLIWYPVVEAGRAADLERAFAQSGLRRVQLFELGRAEPGSRPGMTAAGMVVVNPPFTLAADMTGALAYLAPLLSEDGEPRYRVVEIVGE